MDNVEFGLDDVLDLTETEAAASPEGGTPGEAAEPTEPITGETVSEVPFLDKPFSEYTTSESLLLLLLAIALIILIQNTFRRE